MKKKIILTTIISLFLAIAVSAQTKPKDFSGEWKLDVSKSKLPEQMRIESMTMTVTQTDKEIKIERATKRAPRPDGDNGGGRGGIGRGGFGGDDGAVTYTLDGKETTGDLKGGMMTGKETLQAKFASDGKLSLTETRNLDTQKGNVTIKINETWELDGYNLKVTRYMETPRGAVNAELNFLKQGITTKVAADDTPVYKGAGNTSSSTTNNSDKTPKTIDGGVINGKATKLARPEYPNAARLEQASGKVLVQVTIDEEGNIISAKAFSGHPALRQAAAEAALRSKFAPTTLSGNPVKVTGIIVYNFVP